MSAENKVQHKPSLLSEALVKVKRWNWERQVVAKGKRSEAVFPPLSVDEDDPDRPPTIIYNATGVVRHHL